MLNPYERRIGPQDLDKWLITMVTVVSPLTGVVGPLPNGQTKWLINGGDPNHLLIGMILQVTNPSKIDLHNMMSLFPAGGHHIQLLKLFNSEGGGTIQEVGMKSS